MRRAPIPESLGDRFTVHEALQCGVSYGRLRRADIDTPFQGVRRRRGGDPPVYETADAHGPSATELEILDIARSYFAIDRPRDMFLSHTTAAILLGLPLASSYIRRGQIEVCRVMPANAPRSRRVRGHQVSPESVRIGRTMGLPVSVAAATWAMLADRLPLDELVALGDAAIRIPRRPGTTTPPSARGLATLEELEREQAVPGRRGALGLRAALPLLRQGSSSRPETLLRLQLAAPGMPPIALDHDVYDPHGRLLGCSEIAYPEFRVAVEYESEHHRVDRDQWNRDIAKYSDYADEGWEVVRITSHHLFQRPGEALRLVRSALGRSTFAHY